MLETGVVDDSGVTTGLVLVDAAVGINMDVVILVEETDEVDVPTRTGRTPYRFMRFEPPQNSPGAPLQT